ncbi:hypothetical protein [Endozoicomonas sp. SCSIO W0465]|uniref:hypothetical protein n=1 Tax=Endozoicomonas sp. SCSIO W0465 TaxID=2918516 RepID=UPI0020758F37|nr:hypothetical protein [Endozoicomonas sp. SCSIO W0465]USE39500.1 hypothetical protein MJO57_15855 [Endozoicomonas sp. SCSIO W0465]
MWPANAANMTLAEISEYQHREDPGLAQEQARTLRKVIAYYKYARVLDSEELDTLKTYIISAGEPEITEIKSLQELSARVIRRALLDVSMISTDARSLGLTDPCHRQIQPGFLSDHHGKLVDEQLKRQLRPICVPGAANINLPYIEFLYYLRSLSWEVYKDDHIERFFRDVVFAGYTAAAKWALKVGGPKVEEIIPEVRSEVANLGDYTAAQTLLDLGVGAFTQEEKDQCLKRAMGLWTSAENIKSWIQLGGRIDDKFLDNRLRLAAANNYYQVSEYSKILAEFYPRDKLDQNLMAAVSDNDLTQARQWQLLGGKAATSEVEERIEQHCRNHQLSKR